MMPPVSTPRLSPTSYVVLATIAWRGPSTPYDLKQFVSRSIGEFWSFPHTQLYSEPERLTHEGLLAEEREEDGRRRRTYSITDAGRAALSDWLREPTVEPPELRDLGLLKLFFGDLAGDAAVVELATVQLAARRERLDGYRRVAAALAERPELAHQLAVLESGIAMEETFAAFWQRIAEHPPPARRKRRRRSGS
jgi:PadR family transcriptional regulator AphA